MKDYSVLSDFEINKSVAEKEYPEAEEIPNKQDAFVSNETQCQVIIKTGFEGFTKDYCNSWADMGPIIEREKISIQFRSRGKKEFNPLAKGFGSDSEMAIHENPLRAAAIVYLMMGDEY